MRVIAFLAGFMISLAACAQDDAAPAKAPAASFEEGKHYIVLDTPVRTITPGKIEVTEVFWYGCSHCYHFEPLINSWEKTLEDDVELVKSPAMWRDIMQTHARIYYAAKALNVLDTVHENVFKAMHNEGKRLENKDAIYPLFAEAGVERGKFDKVFDSFGVKSQVQQADARARSFKVTGTPEVIVDGKYRVTAGSAGSQEGMLQVTNFLIDKIRAEK